MIEIILYKYPLHAQFRVTLFDNFNDIPTFTTTHYAVWRICKVLCAYQTNLNNLNQEVRYSTDKL